MADLVELGSPELEPGAAADANGDPVSDKLAALRSRRVQRKAALREKALAGAVAPPVPPVPPVRAGATPSFALQTGPADDQDAATPAPMPAEPGAVKVLLEGLGFPEVELADGQQERFLREIGETVRETASGLIALLAARRAVKTEFRMDETQVQPEENNPFKFFNVAELALDELFLSHSGGFQPPAEATRAAFEDVQQHSLLAMSAMQRAIKLLFARLSPETIEGQHAEEGGTLRVRGLGARKDKWASYVESHARMNGNIDAIARQIVAEAFAQVHVEQARANAKDYWEKTR
jgi:type VI secretion system FHA domain protein